MRVELVLEREVDPSVSGRRIAASFCGIWQSKGIASCKKLAEQSYSGTLNEKPLQSVWGVNHFRQLLCTAGTSSIVTDHQPLAILVRMTYAKFYPMLR